MGFNLEMLAVIRAHPSPSLDARRIEVVDEDVAEILRGKTPAQRMWMTSRGWSTAAAWVAGGVRAQHPEWDEGQVAAEVRRRLTSGAA